MKKSKSCLKFLKMWHVAYAKVFKLFSFYCGCFVTYAQKMQPFEQLIMEEIDFWIAWLQYFHAALQIFFIFYNMFFLFNNIIP